MFAEYMFDYDITKREVIRDCTLKPSELSRNDGVYWLYAKNNKYKTVDIDLRKCGKWMVFLPRSSVDHVWDKVKELVSTGEFHSTKVSTVNPENPSHVLIVYTKDYTDLSDVINVLDTLENHDIKSFRQVIYYKTDEQTMAGIYAGGKQKPWIYRSDTIREIGLTGSSSSH